MCDRALYYFNAINPSNNKEWLIIHLVKYDEVMNGNSEGPWMYTTLKHVSWPEPKANHFRRIRTWPASDFPDLLLFGDEAFNNLLVRNQQGIDARRRAKDITILKNTESAHKRIVIGYSESPTTWIDLIRKGEDIVDPSTPYRWGYALNVAPSHARVFNLLVKPNTLLADGCRPNLMTGDFKRRIISFRGFLQDTTITIITLV
ncbi:hypothetical protein F5887DRAFT_1076882 [Amanita rubescens]|nr:hypothetical protein F5887DRAFT_1076882 [Amanita rubescens]